MKVCDVVKNSIWYDPRVRKQLFSYVENSIDVIGIGVYEPRYDEEEVRKLPCKISLVCMNKNYYKNNLSFFEKIKRELKTNREIYKRILDESPDIIHANDLNALIPSFKASQKLGCKIIYDSHEIFLENPWIANNRLIKTIWGYYEKKIVKKIDFMICVSNAAKQYFTNKYGIKKIDVVTNCVDLDRSFSPHKKTFPKEVLNHGTFYIGRGYETMIHTADIMTTNKDFQFVVRGLGPMKNQLIELKNKLQLSNVIIADPVKVNELVSYASSAWVGVAITESISTNFELSVSNKIFEYAAAGLPVIMSNIEEHRFLNGKFDFGLILESNTPECLKEKIEYLNDNPELYERLSSNAKKMSEVLNWRTEFSKLVRIEKGILNE